MENGVKLYCKLKKAIYGLKQAGRRWNERLNVFLVGLGFARSIWDRCVYTRGHGNLKMIIIVVVDDLITAYKDKLSFGNFWNAFLLSATCSVRGTHSVLQ